MNTQENTAYSRLIQDVEMIVSKAKASKTGYIETDKDWEVLIDLFKLWASYLPNDYSEFKEYVTLLKSETTHTKGITRGKNGGMVQHQLEVPGLWWKMVQVIYPLQAFDKGFTKELSKRLSILNISSSVL